MKKFVCPDCEDYDEVGDEVKWMLCECGEIMEEEKPDMYTEVEYIESCMICRNRQTDVCHNCRRA